MPEMPFPTQLQRLDEWELYDFLSRGIRKRSPREIKAIVRELRKRHQGEDPPYRIPDKYYWPARRILQERRKR